MSATCGIEFVLFRSFRAQSVWAFEPGPLAQAIVSRAFWRLRGKLAGVRCKVQVYCFADILKRFLFRLALRPAAFEGRNVGNKVAVLARFNDDVDVHGDSESMIARPLLEA